MADEKAAESGLTPEEQGFNLGYDHGYDEGFRKGQEDGEAAKEMGLRHTAISIAVNTNGGATASAEAVIASAKKIAGYLKGEEGSDNSG